MWFYDLNGSAVGPVSLDDIRALIADRVIGRSTKVWTEGMADWLSLEETELRSLLPVAPPPLHRPAPPPLQTSAPLPSRAPSAIAGVKPLSGRGRWLSISLLVSAATCAVAGLIILYWMPIFIKANAKQYNTQEEYLSDVETATIVEGFSNIAVSALICIAGLIYFFWIYRAASNVRAINPQSTKMSPGWMIGWTFVPIWQAWKPYQALKQLYRATMNPHDPASVTETPGFRLWWGAFYLAILFFLLGAIMVLPGNFSFPNAIAGTILRAIGYGLYAVSFYYLWQITSRITHEQAGAEEQPVAQAAAAPVQHNYSPAGMAAPAPVLSDFDVPPPRV